MTETRQAPMTPSGIFHPILDDVVSTTKNWWLLLVAGVAWIVIAVVILFVYYFPIWTGISIDRAGYYQRMWFQGPGLRNWI